MATMVPATIPNAPESSQMVFDLLRDDPATDGWVIIHSVSSPTEGSLQGIDFLALVPNQAILCVEVKGGGFQIKQGQWFALSTNDRVESPGRQVARGIDGLDGLLRDHFVSWGTDMDLPMDGVILFTDTTWPPHLRPLAYPTVGLPDQVDQTLGERLAEIAREIHEDIPDGVPLDSETVKDIQNYLAGELAWQ